jgi:hypothetical protein
LGSQNVGQKSVRVVSGTGTTGIQQVNITGASGGLNWPQWVQLTAAQFAAGPTGSFPTVQAMNTGGTGGFRRVQIVGYLGPS